MRCLRKPSCMRLPFWVLIAFAITIACADAAEFRDLTIEVSGQGADVVMIPGLNSSSAVWRETCDAIEAQARCHLVQLPGFAGAPGQWDAVLPNARDQLIAYVRARKLQAPIIVGHSLGGVVALMIGIEAPELPRALLIIDSLPFLPAATQPSATVQTMAPVADNMRASLRAAPESQYRTQLQVGLRTMTRDPRRIAQLEQWAFASHRETTAQAMYELFTTDLRPSLSRISAPTVVLASWAQFASVGGTRKHTQTIFAQQYGSLPHARVVLSNDAYHFIMWDDATLVQNTLDELLKHSHSLAVTR